MYSYAFCCALRYGVGIVEGGGWRFVGIFWKQPHQRSKVIQSQSALKMSNLFWRTPEQNIVHCWGSKVRQGSTKGQFVQNWPMAFGGKNPWPVQCISGIKGHVRVSGGQREVNLLRNGIRLTNSVRRIPDHSVIHGGGQRSGRGQLQVNLFWIGLGPLAGSSSSSMSARWRTFISLSLTSVMHFWDQRSCKGQRGSKRSQSAIKEMAYG